MTSTITQDQEDELLESGDDEPTPSEKVKNVARKRYSRAERRAHQQKIKEQLGENFRLPNKQLKSVPGQKEVQKNSAKRERSFGSTPTKHMSTKKTCNRPSYADVLNPIIKAIILDKGDTKIKFNQKQSD